jgi:uncharacterized protein
MTRTAALALICAAGLCAGAVLVFALFVLRQDRLLYAPTRRLARAPRDLGLDADELTVVTEDGVRLRGWWIRGSGRRALLYFHGNGGNAADRLERAKEMTRRFGFDVFLVDYRGYGESDGEPSEEGLYRDARAIYRTAAGAGFSPDRIVIFGESLGAAVAIDLARLWGCAAVILETPFLSVPALARVHYPFVPLSLVRSRFDNGAKIGDVRAPKLFLLAEHDDVAPMAQGRRLFETARGRRELYVAPGARHNEVAAAGGEAYWAAWEKFLSPAP